MEKKTRDLEALVLTQKEQLTRYEKRLKDVVTAYKGLLKEKEALETSLSAFTKSKEATNVESSEKASSAPLSTADATEINTNLSVPTQSNDADDEKNQLQTQIITLMNSLATLSAEKSRMEASFQADKKQLRAQIALKEQNITELHSKIKEHDERAKSDVNEVKAKWIIERQEREKETNNQMLMIRELQKLYADERHLKENIEMQLNNFKTQFASNEAENTRLRELQAQLKDAKMQLKQFQAKHKQGTGEDESANSLALLQQVQQEMQQLKEQHAIAIKNEQRRVLRAEDQSRKQAALHEDRVANLESRLAELSNTVGNYDRLRQQDQENILALKQQLIDLEANAGLLSTEAKLPVATLPVNTTDMSALVDEIVRLKKLLMNENARSENPIDLSKVFVVGADHMQCHQDLQSLQHQLDNSKAEVVLLKEKLKIQKTHITTLQEKVKVLNRNIDEAEIELKLQGEKLRQAVKEESAKWKNSLTELENESRFKVNELEQQLQKQRQRSLQLLDEKEQEIKTLQTSFEVFHNASSGMSTVTNAANINCLNDSNGLSSDAESIEGTSGSLTDNNKLKLGTKTKKLSLGENCHMLHYVNELARKDIEIATLRKARYAAETSLRRAIQEKVTAQENLNDKIEILEHQVDRLERCKTREGANLEYLKNVIISFIVTKDAEDKRHMLNAISAVLQFTNAEIQTINSVFIKK